MTHSRLLAVLLTLCVLLTGCVPREKMSPTAIDITGLEYGKDFKLSDPGGKERTLKEFRGKVVMVFFGFTQCPDVCPTALYRAAEVKKKLGEEGSKFQTIFVTVDPERDTPTLLKDYTHAFDDSFLGLYTDLENTRKTADDFRIYYAKVSTGSTYTMDHTAISYLYDTKGNIRIGIKPNASIDDVTQDVRFLLQN
ncbi:SCO family protein [Herminiimonas contaminans]|uniref:SCO family protein n=2 Tax=Herminiimonas contaminans TaxID=1111140 RepID=A0ABS0EWX9_9BURK|nr:SCO family protein [Herminiimonas contaminans]